jgi:Class III cytochrome C family
MKRPWIWIVLLVNLFVLIVLAFVFPRAMVSPGPLLSAHAEIADNCFACHAPFRGTAPDRCIKCHALRDIGIINTKGAPIERHTKRSIQASFHQDLSEQNCSSCHNDHGRLTERRFSHALLRPASRRDCAACHSTPANDFHRVLRVSCNQCHNTERWSQATFDHAQLPNTALTRCESCHDSPKDNFHQQIASSCTQCHSSKGWKPSTFDHDRFFVLDGDHNTTCATCHSNKDFKFYTCYGCHEHTPSNIRSEHEEEGIRNFNNCVSCHKSAEGESGDGGEGD